MCNAIAEIVEYKLIPLAETTHQFSILLTETCKLFLWCAQCVQGLHEEGDLLSCIIDEKNRGMTESGSLLENSI